MDTITRTFPIKLTSAYTAGSIIEFCHFRDMLFDADERVSVYLESFFCNLNLKSFLLGVIAEFDGDESEAEKMAKFTVAESRSQKLGLRILNRKNNTGDWEEIAEIILVNRGRKDYFDLLQPYLAKNQVAILEKNDALAIQLIDYGNGLLKEGDSLRIVSGVTITISKKNDVEALQARISALELALEGKLTNLPSNSLLGRDVNTGVVEVISQAKFATPAQIDQAIIDLVGGAPGALNTLVELASALNNDANFASTITNQLALKANISALANYLPKGGYTSNNPDTFTSGIEGADRDLGEGLAGWHFITNLRASNTYGIQLAICDTSPRIKYRHKSNNIWQTWKTLFTGNNAAVENKFFTGTTSSAMGNYVEIVTGIPRNKITCLNVLVSHNNIGGYMSSGHTYHPGYQYDAYIEGDVIVIVNHPTNSNYILSRPFKATVEYQL